MTTSVPPRIRPVPDFDRDQAVTTAAEPQQAFAVLLTPFRLVVFLMAVAAWTFVVLPVWLVMILRAVAMFSLNNLLSVFNGGHGADPGPFERIVTLWPRGFVLFLGILRGTTEVERFLPPTSRILLIESGLAFVWWAALLVYFGYGPAVLLAIGHWIWAGH